ncbi:hemagglutinin repeat-containing protein [Veillonella sp. CHU732]|uniref:hemagglutinin repeat-containing protein n=1 Tax=Veillonella sp. CHU732 TaxID=2490949 RepID=UPI0013E08F52|nr:hemagglutinin repeat-containing protein [Veillonella sp. CHU732]
MIGSRFGSVTLGATGSTQVEASDVTSKGDIQVQGSGVTIRNGYTTSHTEETHRFSKSGLTLSLSNRLVDTTTNAVGTLTRANSVKDERLKALLAYKTYDDAKTSLEKSKLKDQVKSLHLNLSLGTERSEASTNVDSKIAKASTVVSEGHVRVTTKKDDLRIEESDVQGKDITLDSANSIYVKGKETTSEMTQSMKQKQGSLGISYDVLQHRFSDISVNASGSKGSIAGTDIVHAPTKITASNTLGVSTKQDLNIKDGVFKGEAIQANIGGNLEIHSVQDTHDYTDHTTSGGMGLSLSKKGAFKSLQSSLQRTDIDSKYTSVIHQSGLYAGSTGFNISVGNTTTLEGALLASRTDTNTLKTKYLVMKDMKNRAKYTYGSKGVSYLSDVQYRKSLEHMRDRKNAILTDKNLSIPAKIQHLQQLNQDKEYTSHLKYVNSLYNQVGLLPNMLPGERKEVHSVTRSAIAPGTIDVENPRVDVSQINRDINHSLQALDTIFNKQDIQERQELTKLFNKYANEAIHHISDMAGWKEGSSEKVALHAIVGNISANIVNGNTRVGTAAGGLSELLAPAILEASNGDPAKAQWLAYALGYATDKLLGGTGELGGSISHYGVKWNLLLNEHAKTIRQERYNAFIEKFKVQYREMEDEGNPYDEETINQAENDLWRILYWNKKAKKLPQATELLGLFIEPENNQDIIEKSEEILPGFPLYVLNENSKVHQYLANNDELNKEIISKTILNTYMYDLPQLTHEGTISYYWKGVDEALAYGTASYIATYQIEGDLVYAKITIIDNWDHDKNESKVEFLEDAYILQQSKRKKIFAYKTTYDVAFKMDELMSIG